MSDIIKEVRELKSKALDARDIGRLNLALDYLGQAINKLSSALANLRVRRDPGESPGQQEIEIATQLCHILGSKGGVLRRAGDYIPAALAYDGGYDLEKPSAEYGIVNSYNMVQRLVARVFAEPKAILPESEPVAGVPVHHELSEAKKEIRRQLDGPRSHDEYAAADLATVSLLLEDDWEQSLDEFLLFDPKPEPYAFQVTLELLEALRDRVASTLEAPPGLQENLTRAVQVLSANT